MLNTICITLMIISVIGLVICMKNQRTSRKAGTYMVLCVVVAALSAFFYFDPFGFNSASSVQQSNEVREARGKAFMLADYANKNFSGKNAVILVGSTVKTNQELKAAVDFFKETVKGKVNVIDEIVKEIPKEDPAMDNAFFTTEFFDSALAGHENIDLVVNFLGFPADEGQFEELALWGFENAKVIVYEPQLLKVSNSLTPIARKMVGEDAPVAAVIIKKNFNFDPMAEKLSKDPKEAFDHLYKLVTKETIEGEVGSSY